MVVDVIGRFYCLSTPVQALIATLFTWGVTVLGAGVVFAFKRINKSVMDAMLGFAGGVMIAASYFSLLSPALDMAESIGAKPWLTVAAGFMCGGLLLFIGDKAFGVLDRLDRSSRREADDGRRRSLKRCWMLIFSITLHNIPEGMAVGVMLAGLGAGSGITTMAGALTLSLGIAIQNFPEGAISSLPLRSQGMSRPRAFAMGALSGAVEPVAAIATLLLARWLAPVLPVTLAFAAGAMFYVVVEKLIPESAAGSHSNIGTIGFALGFVLMMALDVALA